MVEPRSAVESEPPLGMGSRVMGYTVWGLTVVTALGVAICGLSLEYLGDRWWLATVLLYGPRWPLAAACVPALALSVLAQRWRASIVLAVAMTFSLGPYMGFNVPWRCWTSTRPKETLRIVVFNAGHTTDTSRLSRFIQSTAPDVLVMPECGDLMSERPVALLEFEGKQSHSVCVFSRFPIESFDVRDPEDIWKLGGSGEIALARIAGPHGEFSLLALHLETVREGLERLVAERSPRQLISVTNLRRHESHLAREFGRRARTPLVVVGDFNMPVESGIYVDFWSDLQNGFGQCGWGYGATKLTSWFGIRIDHVLLDAHWVCASAQVGPDLGSDHRPLVVDAVLK